MGMGTDTERDARIATLEHELAKADRRTAEQERIMAAMREKLERRREVPTGAVASSVMALERPDAPSWPVIAIRGTWRIYFHRLNPDGLPWCVALEGGGWEMTVRDVQITTASRTVYRPKATPDDEDGRPSAWIEAAGLLTVGPDGNARIEP